MDTTDRENISMQKGEQPDDAQVYVRVCATLATMERNEKEPLLRKLWRLAAQSARETALRLAVQSEPLQTRVCVGCTSWEKTQGGVKFGRCTLAVAPRCGEIVRCDESCLFHQTR